ncbi:MAG: M36 family metallopeptidase [Lysobacterales bacterium]
MSLYSLRRLAVGALAVAVSSALSASEIPEHRLTGPASGPPAAIASAYLQRDFARFQLSGNELEHRVRDVVPTRHNGLTHVYLQQTVEGIDVDGAITTVNVMRDGVILSVADAFVREAPSRINRSAPAIDAGSAYLAVADYFKVPMARAPQSHTARGGASRHQVFSGEALSAQPVPAELIYVREGDALRLAWNLTVDRFESDNVWAEVRIDAETGEVIDLVSYVAHLRSPALAKGSVPTSYSASYRVLPMPFETPQDPGASFQVVTDPHDPQASPRGWHDTRDLTAPPGFEFAETRGNNVVARADLLSNNSVDNFRAPATVNGTALAFDFAFDPAQPPTNGQNQPAVGNVPPALVNLFYWNNVLHDVLWHYGFDEPAGSFQVNNYGRGGAGNDAVNADALDGSDRSPPNTNNANFGTPPDGSAPRMQMFRWTAPVVGSVTFTAPLTAEYPTSAASFGGSLGAPLNGSFALVDDGGADGGVLGCSALTNGAEISGRIAVVKRGVCEFGVKALNAQNAGAVAVLMWNNQGGTALFTPGAGAVGAQVTVPVFTISQNNGDSLALELANAFGQGTLSPAVAIAPDRDSDFDAGIIAHEYAHGLSNRLTGGPSASTCLNNAEQKGEGWSDFVGLMVTLRPNACAAPRGIGTYPSFQAVTGPGIRRFPYSPDRAVNPFTFADTNNPLQSQPHGIGSVWATMLWDMTCKLIDEHGFDPDLVRGTGGNNIAMQLVVDGMKAQPCRPGFVDARNGILTADEANNQGANRCTIWRTFAARGLGQSASSGLNTDRSDQVEAFNLPTDCADHVVTLQVAGQGTASPNAAQGVLTGGVARYVLTPASGYRLQSVEGCAGTLSGSVFTTAAVTANCTVTVNFEAIPMDVFADGFEP